MSSNNGNSSNGNGSTSRWWSRLWSNDSRRNGLDQLEPYRRLALQLHYDLPREQVSRSVLLVTPTASTASALASEALATCVAEELRQPVLLIDASPRSPDVSRLLGCSHNKGFTDCLSDPGMVFEKLVLATSHPNVSFLPAGARVARGQSSPEDIQPLLKSLERDRDFVLLSGGAVLSDSMALALAPYVGCVLLLAIENETKMEDLDAAERALSLCRARKVELVFTTELGRRGKRYVSSVLSVSDSSNSE